MARVKSSDFAATYIDNFRNEDVLPFPERTHEDHPREYLEYANLDLSVLRSGDQETAVTELGRIINAATHKVMDVDTAEPKGK